MNEFNKLDNKATRDFLAEAEDIVERLGVELDQLIEYGETGHIDPDLINSIFRGAHSLKGLAGMFGFHGIANLSHAMENLLDKLRLGKLEICPPVTKLLFQSHKFLNSLIRNIHIGRNEVDPGIDNCIGQIDTYINSVNKQDCKIQLAHIDLPERISKTLTEYEEHRLLENMRLGRQIYCIHTSFDLSSFDQDLTAFTEKLKAMGELISTLPGIGESLESHIDFDLLFGSQNDLDQINEIATGYNATVDSVGYDNSLDDDADLLSDVHSTAISVTDIPDAKTDTGFVISDRHFSAKSLTSTVRVDIEKLDELMNIVGELAVAHGSISNMVNRLSKDFFSSHCNDLIKGTRQLERKLIELQKQVMSIRMVPVGQIYEKMSLVVRQISREQGKKVELCFFGEDTELDKLIVEDVSDPLMHIIRNAIDHGIESPDYRRSVGKRETGTISISASQRGSHVVLDVRDDGAGIDIERVKSSALQKGLVQDIYNVTDRDALDFIFLPGFSTLDAASDISGRGVGMDVVRNNIAAISGMVDIETTRGEGTCFSITLPITLAIIKVLLISVAGRTYGLPITSVRETLLLEPDDICTIEAKEVINLRNFTLPLLRLDSFFNLDRQIPKSGEFYVVVIGMAEKRIGIIVDELLGQQDTVIKSLGEMFNNFKGISGAAELGDQKTILILDTVSIISESTKCGN